MYTDTDELVARAAYHAAFRAARLAHATTDEAREAADRAYLAVREQMA